ncbi:MAG TPA: creatininase family protein [Firmicutes bacterium]|nr:creatininase family protein [Bacillota bacterium]
MGKIHYAQMLLHEFRAALEKMPLAWVPVGLLEWHGEHLPLGTDLIRAEHACAAAAAEIGGIVLPGLYTSCKGYGSYEGTVIFNHRTAVTIGLELAAQLQKIGFKAAFFLSAHGGQYQEAFLEELEKSYTGTMVVRTLPLSRAAKRGDHAGVSETSDMCLAAPELVDLSRLTYPDQHINRYDVPPETLCRGEERPWRWKEDWRDQAGSTIGRENLERVIEHCRRWVEELQLGKDSNR